MKGLKGFALIGAGVALAASLAACDGSGFGYSGPPYVIGKYMCPNPNSGWPSYCVEYSDGTSAIVPLGIYDDVYYGSTLNYYGGRWITGRSSYYSRRYVPVVTHVSYHVHSFTSTSTRTRGGYVGGNYVKNGRTIYRAPSVRSQQISSYRSSYSSVRSRF